MHVSCRNFGKGRYWSASQRLSAASAAALTSGDCKFTVHASDASASNGKRIWQHVGSLTLTHARKSQDWATCDHQKKCSWRVVLHGKNAAAAECKFC